MRDTAPLAPRARPGHLTFAMHLGEGRGAGDPRAFDAVRRAGYSPTLARNEHKATGSAGTE